MEPTLEQLRTFYRVVHQYVRLSSYVAFVELAEDGNLFVYVGRYNAPLVRSTLFISPEGEVNDYA